MKPLTLCLTALLTLRAAADPQLTSWFTANSGKYARIYQSAANETAGTTSTTWSRGSGTQSSPVYADVSEINYSASWVYIRTSGLASHIMGPWYLDSAKTQNFPNFPSNTATIYRIPRTPAIPTTKTLTGLGATGRMVNGVSMFDARDAFSYVNASATDATPTNGLTGDGIWNRDGYHNEGVTFDPALAHQAGNNYHYHAHPIALRYQLGDHVDYNAATNRYTESAATPTTHSPILAWAADGLPVYGPYGYSDPTNAASGVRRMISGYTKRDGTNGTTAITVRQVLPLWAQRVQGRTTLTSSQYGPAVNTTYALGHYIEDFDYRGDLGQTQTTGATVRDFDLNEYNVRFCVTPEFPSGTWAYFTPINADGTPQYPYTTGRQYYGNPTGGGVTSITETVTQQFIGGPNKALTINTPSVAGTTVTLTWNAVEGGTYSVDASPNQSTWTSKATGVVSTGNTASQSYTALGTNGAEYGRVNRTALATYDTNGFTTATVAQSATTSYVVGGINTTPTITNIANQSIPQNTATGALAFTIGDAESAAENLVMSGSSSNTTLVPNANIVFVGGGASRTVTITPASNQTGTGTITVTVSDGSLTASTTFTLTVTPSAPAIGNVATNPAIPTSGDNAIVTAAITPPSGRTISSALLVYSTNAQATNTVFNETMASAAVTGWTGTGTAYPWTVVYQGIATAFKQTTAGNHTATGQGNPYGMEVYGNSPTLANNYITTTNAIDATGSAGSVEFWVSTSGMTGTQGWDFQTSTDGTTWTTRLSDLNIAQSYGFTQKTYTLSAAERVATLKLRFRFAGGGANQTPSIRLDDIKVTSTSAASPINVIMYDDGAHGDGAAGDGIYGANIPAQSAGTVVSYTITAGDSAGATTTTGANYTVVTPSPVLSVTPSGTTVSSGPSGGPFSPASASYTLTNTGTGTLSWSVLKTAAWFDLSATSGSLAAGASTTVNATINPSASNLTTGNFSDTITFTNNTNGAGTTTRGISLAVLSTNADLSSLTLGTGTLSPSFASGTTAYTATVANNISSLNITPTTQDAAATVTVNGIAVASGSASGAISLTVGENVISTVVTPQNGTPSKTYTITVTRMSPMQSWRQSWYGTSNNSGNAADLADPYHTGYSNLAVYAFFGPTQDPATAGGLQLPQPALVGGNFTCSFTQPDGVSGVTYGAQWSTELSGNNWHDIPDTGSGSQHVFTIPVGGNTRTFMRLQVTAQ